MDGADFVGWVEALTLSFVACVCFDATGAASVLALAVGGAVEASDIEARGFCAAGTLASWFSVVLAVAFDGTHGLGTAAGFETGARFNHGLTAGAGASTYLMGSTHVVFVDDASASVFSFLSPLLPPFLRPRDDALSPEPRFLPPSALAACVSLTFASHTELGASGRGCGVSSRATVAVDGLECSSFVGLEVPLAWLEAGAGVDLVPMLDEAPTSAEFDLVECAFASSSRLSAHRVPLSSDLSEVVFACSFAGVMAPDVGLLDCVEAEFDAPRAAWAYENGAADLAVSDCVDDMAVKY